MENHGVRIDITPGTPFSITQPLEGEWRVGGRYTGRISFSMYATTQDMNMFGNVQVLGFDRVIEFPLWSFTSSNFFTPYVLYIDFNNLVQSIPTIQIDGNSAGPGNCVCLFNFNRNSP